MTVNGDPHTRGLAFAHLTVVFAGAARPIESLLTPFWKRRDGKRIPQGRQQTEQYVKRYKE